jgi:hypothetical protein
MRAKLFNLLIGMIFIALLMNMVSALNGFTFYSYQMNNSITRYYGEMSYSQFTENYMAIKKNPNQIYLTYGLEPIVDWNANNPANQIDWCEINIGETHFYGQPLQNYTITQYSTIFTIENISVTPDSFRHFIDFNEQDRANVTFDCHFTGNPIIQTPISLSASTPTWECKACQNYNYYKSNLDDAIGEGIQIKTTQIETDIKDFVKLIINISITLFWIIKIMFVIGVIGMIFIGIWWIYLFLRHLIGKV